MRNFRWQLIKIHFDTIPVNYYLRSFEIVTRAAVNLSYPLSLSVLPSGQTNLRSALPASSLKLAWRLSQRTLNLFDAHAAPAAFTVSSADVLVRSKRGVVIGAMTHKSKSNEYSDR